MDTGMLWFDNDMQRDLTAKVGRAASYYRKKHGKKAALCFVNPTMLGEDAHTLVTSEGVEIRPSITVLPHHFWIGASEN